MPFIMAPINAGIVRRSLALSGRLPCAYEENISVGAWLNTTWLWMSRGMPRLRGVWKVLNVNEGSCFYLLDASLCLQCLW